MTNLLLLLLNLCCFLLPWVQYCRRKQAGVYTSYTFGPVGRQIKVSKLMNLDSLLMFHFFHIGDCKQVFSG